MATKPISADRIHLGPVDLTSGATDPISGGGVAAPIGSAYQESNGTAWQKPKTADPLFWLPAPSRGLLAALPASLSGQLDLYVNGATGSDANDGLTSGTAMATIGALRIRYEYTTANHQRVVVHLAGGAGNTIQTYAEDVIWIGGGSEAFVASWRYEGPEMARITPTSGPATAALDAVPATRVDQSSAGSATGNRTRLNFTTAAPGWTVNNFAGYFLRVTRGASKVFFELPISENDASHLIVDSLGIVGVLLNTDTVEIVRPLVKIVAPPGGTSLGILTLAGRGGGLAGGVAFGNSLHSIFTRCIFEDLFSTGVNAVSFDRCLFTGSSTFGFGLALHAFGTGIVNCSTWTLVALGGSTYGNDSCDAVTPIAPGPGVMLCGAIPSSGGGASWPQLFIGNMVNQLTVCSCVVDAAYPISIYDSNGYFANWGSITVDAGSQLVIREGNTGPGATPVTINGNRNAQIGIRCRRASRIRVNGGQYTQITGTAGSLMVETGAAIAYGTGAGQFEQAVGWNGNFTRMLEGASAAAPTGDVSMITTRALA